MCSRLCKPSVESRSNTLITSSFLQLLFDGGSVQSYLTTVHTWLQANPDEVLTLLFTNPEGVSLPNVWDPAFQASGIAQMAYVPPSTSMKWSDVSYF